MLKCNIEKTFIMRIGDTSGEISEEIFCLGFNFVDKVKILGFEVSNTQEWDKNNFTNVLKKIRNLISFWSCFYLSMIGKKLYIKQSCFNSRPTRSGGVNSQDYISDYNSWAISQ